MQILSEKKAQQKPSLQLISNIMLSNLKGKKIILASKSPRRHELLRGLELDFEVRTKDVDESFPDTLKAEKIPLYLAKIKADAFLPELKIDEVLITADTVVWIHDHVLNKAADKDEAIQMLSELSGNTHSVYTAVCISSIEKQLCFYDQTEVQFSELSPEEIEHYVDVYKPYDKAGSYGAQDWIGYVAIRSLKGSYFNVMGLPVDILYRELKNF